MTTRLFMGTLVAVAGMAAALWAAPAAAGVMGQGTWQSTLLGRNSNGHAVAASGADAVFLYDTVLNITWLRDANDAGTSGAVPDTGYGLGATDWQTAMTWAGTLQVGSFGGWRLPSLAPINGLDFQLEVSNNGSTDLGYGQNGSGWGTVSELGYLYYATLGNLGYCAPDDLAPQTSCDQAPGWGLSNTGDFMNMQSWYYWTGQEVQPNSSSAFVFGMGEGALAFTSEFTPAFYAMAVRQGDVANVPEPRGPGVLLLALLALGVARRRSARQLVAR